MELSPAIPLSPLGKAVERRIGDFHGKVLVINFWAGWCGPCVHEMPALYGLQNRFGGRGLAVVGLVMDDDPQDGLGTLARRIGEAPFPQFKGAESELVDRFGVESLPYTVIIDRNRKIQYARPGEVDWGGEEARAMIEKML